MDALINSGVGMAIALTRVYTVIPMMIAEISLTRRSVVICRPIAVLMEIFFFPVSLRNFDL